MMPPEHETLVRILESAYAPVVQHLDDVRKFRYERSLNPDRIMIDYMHTQGWNLKTAIKADLPSFVQIASMYAFNTIDVVPEVYELVGRYHLHDEETLFVMDKGISEHPQVGMLHYVKALRLSQMDEGYEMEALTHLSEAEKLDGHLYMKVQELEHKIRNSIGVTIEFSGDAANKVD